MKIVAVLEDGKEIEIKEIQNLPDEGILLARLNVMLRPQDRDSLESELTEKIGKKVVILPYFIGKVMCIK